MKISAFLSKSDLERPYILAKQSRGMFYSLHGKIALSWRIDPCLYFTSGRVQLK